MRRTSKYIGILINLLSLTCTVAFAQEKDSTLASKHSSLNGFSVYIDVADIVKTAINSNYYGFNASANISINNTLYPTAEVGYAKINATDDYSYITEQPNNYGYEVSGMYFKAGADLSILKKKDNSNKISPRAFIGARYAISPFKYEISNYSISNGVWDGFKLFSANGNTTAQWLEVTAGINTPVAGNLCMGMEVRYKSFLHCKDKYDTKEGIQRKTRQSYAPGFGDFNDGVWGFRYTISYFFHL